MERYLIGRIEKDTTKAGRPVVNLFSTDGRLQYPVLTLFDFSALADVGIDPNALGSEPVHKRFWAYYETSSKLTSEGNPYRDVQYLEAIDAPASAASTDVSALLAELRAIRALLQALAIAQGLVIPDEPEPGPGDTPQELDASFPRYGNGEPVGDNPQELAAWQAFYQERAIAPADVDELRAWERKRRKHGRR